MIELKSKVIVINSKKTKVILLIAIIFICIFTISNVNKESNSISQINYIAEECSNNNEKKSTNTENVIYKQKEIDFPKEIENVEVIGKLEIPKIDLITYILAQTSKENLNKSVTKLCGPKVNGVGNLCITGHNYHNDKMFGNLKKLEIDDEVKITDMKGITVHYQIYDIFKIYPKETDCLSQETGGEREVTLITCTTGGMKRLIIKAVEIYD